MVSHRLSEGKYLYLSFVNYCTMRKVFSGQLAPLCKLSHSRAFETKATYLHNKSQYYAEEAEFNMICFDFTEETLHSSSDSS